MVSFLINLEYRLVYEMQAGSHVSTTSLILMFKCPLLSLCLFYKIHSFPNSFPPILNIGSVQVQI